MTSAGESIPIVFLGSKDHGKSTLIGRLLVDSGSVKQQKIDELMQLNRAHGATWELAHLLDSFREEREQGMTMETTRAWIKGAQRFYEFIDVPGHEELLAQMVSGAGAASTAVLVVSALDGIEAQTHHHVQIACLLGVERIILAINKMDAVGFRRDIFHQWLVETERLLSGMGFGSEVAVPIAAVAGDNVLRRSTSMPWYQGPTLFECFERFIPSSQSPIDLPLRFLVQDTYQRGNGTLVIGRVESGRCRVGQPITFVPGGYHDRLVRLYDGDGEVREDAADGIVGVTVTDPSRVARGMVGAAPEALPHVSQRICAELLWLLAPSSDTLVCECGTAAVEGRVTQANRAQAGEVTRTEITLSSPLAFETSSNTVLGKLVVKDRGKIIGVGPLR